MAKCVPKSDCARNPVFITTDTAVRMDIMQEHDDGKQEIPDVNETNQLTSWNRLF